LLEDVACTAEAFYDREKITSLLIPGSPGYDQRFGEKLKLLRKYGFFRDNEYSRSIFRLLEPDKK
jgi:hypothetical protein